MAHKMLKLASFILYLLAIIAFFFIGVSLAGILDAGKGQGLAGGAIVFFYGLIGSVIGLVLSLFAASHFDRKVIFKINIILVICIIAFYAFFHFQYIERENLKVQKTTIESDR